jgi:DNA-binding NarL/FixJ family response regulator
MLLSIDNEPSERDLLRCELAHAGVDVNELVSLPTVRDAITWLALHRRVPVELVILDRNRKAPGDDNLVLVPLLRPALTPTASVIIHSGWDKDEQIAEVCHTGVDAFISKHRASPNVAPVINQVRAFLQASDAAGRRPWIVVGYGGQPQISPRG